MDNFRDQKEESAYYHPRQPTTPASEEEEKVNLEVIKPKPNCILRQVQRARKALNSSSSKSCQLDSGQLVVKKDGKKHQNSLFNIPKHPSAERQSIEIEDTFRKSHNPSIDGERQEKEKIKIQNFNLKNNDTCEKLGSSVYSKNPNAVTIMSGIRLSTKGRNSLEDSSFSNPVTQSPCTEIEYASKKSHIPICDDGRLEKEGMRVHSNVLEKNAANGSLDGQGISRNSAYADKNMSGIGVSIEGKNLSEDSSYSDQSKDITYCTVSPVNLQDGGAYSECATASRHTYPHNVPAQSCKLQDGRPSSGLAADSINTNDQDTSKCSDLTAVFAKSTCSEQSGKLINASKKPSSRGKSGYIYHDTSKCSDLTVVFAKSTCSEQSGKLINANKKPSSHGKSGYIYQDTSKCSDLTAVLAKSTCSEQSGKPINASKETFSNGKSQNRKNGKLEVVANAERVPQTSVELQSDPSCYPSNIPNAYLTDWIVLGANQHGRESHADFNTESPSLGSSGHSESTNVELANVNRQNFQNQLLFTSREEQKDEHDIFDVKGKVISNKLRNLPKKQAIEAEKQIAYILFQSEVYPGQGKSQTENLSNPYLYARRSVDEMCEGILPPSQRSPSPRSETGSRVRSPNRQRRYPQLPQENDDWDEEEYTELGFYGQDLSPYDPDSEFDEQESEEEFMTVIKPLSPSKKLPCITECAKRPPLKKKSKQPKENASPMPPPSYTYMKGLLLAFLVILCAVAAVIFVAPFWPKILETFSKVNTPPPIGVTTIIENLKVEFSEQPPMTFKIVNNALRRVTEPNPKEPAIILLFAEQGAEEIAGRFARKIAESVTSPDDIVLISGHTYRNEDHDTAKKEIDDLLNENLTEDKLGVVLIERLDYIPAEAAIILHTYCDHENAPFKRAIYVMTIASKKTQLKLHEPKDWDTMVQEHLSESWSTGGDDQVSSLLSRLTVSVAAIVSGG